MQKFQMTIRIEGATETGNSNIKLENNLLLLFPSTFYHSVNPSKEKGSRYSLAFNITTNLNEN